MKITNLSAAYILQACGAALTLGFAIVVAALTEEPIPLLGYLGMTGFVLAPYVALHLATRARWGGSTYLIPSGVFLAMTIYALTIVFDPTRTDEGGAFTFAFLPPLQFAILVISVGAAYINQPTNGGQQ